MAMLAEKKRKQKWSLNPRGKAWSQDSTKFGQKMLEKMGWKHGKGLGANENGITEHVQVSYKNDSKGLGFKSSDDPWIEEIADNFTKLLESLNSTGEKPDEIKVSSLEEKSQTSRARVHYHKFTRGKDLSRYSEKDLASIFGVKKSKESKNETEEKSDSNEGKNKNESKLLRNAGSMRDYFKNKLPNFGKMNGNGVFKQEDSESESEMPRNFGFGYENRHTEEINDNKKTKSNVLSVEEEQQNGNATFVSYINDENDDSQKNKVKTKRKLDERSEESVVSPKKKSKKSPKEIHKKKSSVKEEVMGLSNPAFNPLCTPVKVQKHLLNTIQESIAETSESEEHSPKTIEIEAEIYENGFGKKHKAKDTPKKMLDDNEERKKPKKGYVNNGDVKEIGETPKKKKSSTEENCYEARIERKKKEKKGGEMALDNPNFDLTTEEVMDSSQIEELPYEVKVKKKKKKKKAELFALENPNFSETLENSVDSSQVEENPYEVKVKRKKKKKTKEEKSAIDNLNFNASTESYTDCVQVEENSYEVKNKKKTKKNKETFAIDNPHFDPNGCVDAETKNNVFEVERKKKKSKKNKEERGIVNPALNLDTSCSESQQNASVELEECDLMLNIVSTPIVPKTKPVNEENSYSVKRVMSVRRTKSVRFSDVTEERVIPNNDELRNMREIDFDNETVEKKENRGKKRKRGLDNGAFDKQKNNLEENLDTISKKIDMYQAEIENDINENKLETFEAAEEIMVGEVGNPHGDNERLPDGIKLKFKYAQFKAKTPFYQLDKIGSKKSYKHLIKGDIVVKFKDANLHQIDGYANNKN